MSGLTEMVATLRSMLAQDVRPIYVVMDRVEDVYGPPEVTYSFAIAREDDLIATLVDLARNDREADFVFLADASGVGLERQGELWRRGKGGSA